MCLLLPPLSPGLCSLGLCWPCWGVQVLPLPGALAPSAPSLSKPPPVPAGRGRGLSAAAALSLKYPFSLCCSAGAVPEEWCQSLCSACSETTQEEASKAFSQPLRGSAALGRGVPGASAFGHLLQLHLGTGWDSCSPVLAHSQDDGAEEHRTPSQGLSQVGSFPFFLSISQLWIPYRSLCSFQPAGAEPLEISDTEKGLSPFPLANTPATAAGNLGENCAAPACSAGCSPQHFLPCWSKWLFHCSFPGFCFSYRLENALLATLALKQPHAAGSGWPWCSCSAQLSCSSSECCLARVFNKKRGKEH